MIPPAFRIGFAAVAAWSLLQAQEFDSASTKPAQPGLRGYSIQPLPGRINARNANLKQLIAAASGATVTEREAKEILALYDVPVVGEKLTRLIERGTEKELPVIIISTSGGARMYEGMFSLMQMAKTSAALAYHAQKNLPYISVLTHPTTAGVMASYASLGDLILAEPGAMIGFAGPRVIKDTTQAELPPGFQTAEFLLDHGLIDAIVSRKEMKAQLIAYLNFLTTGKKVAEG